MVTLNKILTHYKDIKMLIQLALQLVKHNCLFDSVQFEVYLNLKR